MTNDKIDNRICGDCGLPYNICNIAVYAAWFHRDNMKMNKKDTGKLMDEYRSEILELIVESQVKLLEHLATSDPRYTMAALKDELAELKAQLQDSPSKEDCYCVCHSSFSSNAYCEHCKGDNEVGRSQLTNERSDT